MTEIYVSWKPRDERMAEAIRFAREFDSTHFRFAERNTLLILGSKEELKAAGKTEIFSALPHDDSDPETWGAQWIPNSSRWECRKDLKMWSDEYVAQQRGISFRKEVEHA